MQAAAPMHRCTTVSAWKSVKLGGRFGSCWKKREFRWLRLQIKSSSSSRFSSYFLFSVLNRRQLLKSCSRRRRKSESAQSGGGGGGWKKHCQLACRFAGEKKTTHHRSGRLKSDNWQMWSRARGLRPRRRVPDDGKRTSEQRACRVIANSSGRRNTRNTEQTHTEPRQNREREQEREQTSRLPETQTLSFSLCYFARPTFTPHAPSDTELFGILGGYNWHRPLFSSSSLLSVTKTEPFSLVWFGLIPLFFFKAKSRHHHHHHHCYWSHAFTLIIMWFSKWESWWQFIESANLTFVERVFWFPPVLTTGFEWKKMAAFFSLLFC